MPNNFKPDENGQIEIPFIAHVTVSIDWSADMDYDQIYAAAHEKLMSGSYSYPDWEIDDEFLAELQPEHGELDGENLT
jgi:hypothetical protein